MYFYFIFIRYLVSTMFLVGLTGGIATGKSSVASMLSSMGIKVIDADLIAREGTFNFLKIHFLIYKKLFNYIFICL